MLLLASQSPRRKELLLELGVNFTTLNVDIDETQHADEGSREYVCRLAKQKSLAGLAQRLDVQASMGADTVVVVNHPQEQVLGKPVDFDDACRMWRLLGQGEHTVMTAVALSTHETTYQCLVETQVNFAMMSAVQMKWYWDTNEPQDKAGGYGIQGLAGQFVKHIKGSYSAVVGLPLYETSQLLKQAGIKQYER